jgi:hypothetical protein
MLSRDPCISKGLIMHDHLLGNFDGWMKGIGFLNVMINNVNFKTKS